MSFDVVKHPATRAAKPFDVEQPIVWPQRHEAGTCQARRPIIFVRFYDVIDILITWLIPRDVKAGNFFAWAICNVVSQRRTRLIMRAFIYRIYIIYWIFTCRRTNRTKWIINLIWIWTNTWTAVLKLAVLAGMSGPGRLPKSQCHLDLSYLLTDRIQKGLDWLPGDLFSKVRLHPYLD